MSTENKELEVLNKRIEYLKNKQILSNSPEEKILLDEQISELRKKCKSVKRKEPVITPVINASTIGDSMEAKLKNPNKRSKSLGQNRVLI